MSEPDWLDNQSLFLLVSETLSRYGGRPGLRDEGMLELTLARPVNLYRFQGETSLAKLAAAYGFGLSQSRPFHAGNRRATLIAMALFLGLNGLRFAATQFATFRMLLQLTAGGISETELAAWIEANSAAR